MTMTTTTTFIGGTEKVALTGDLLGLIIMMQDYERFLISQDVFTLEHGLVRKNRDTELERLFFAIDDEILKRHKLSKNKISFEKVMFFKVSSDMKSMEHHLLPRNFTF